jgi:hypothetical protein
MHRRGRLAATDPRTYACGKHGTVFVYNASFEKGHLTKLAERFRSFKRPILSAIERIVDLYPIAREYFYHPLQQGSWSINSLLPAACPDLTYDKIEGVQNGSMAQEEFLEALALGTSIQRNSDIKRQLAAYCGLDTYAMVRL